MSLEFQSDALTRRMETLCREMVEKAARKAVRAGAEVIAAAMTEAAPVLDHRTAKSTALEPGALKADIRVSSGQGDHGEAAAFAGPGKRTAHVARWVEYGHRLVKGGTSRVVNDKGQTRGKGQQVGEVVEHPFLRPAFEASVTEAEAARDEVLREAWQKGGANVD